MPTPEDKARETIDHALEKAGWKVQDTKSVNLNAGRGVAIEIFRLPAAMGSQTTCSMSMARLSGSSKPRKKGSRWLGLKFKQ